MNNKQIVDAPCPQGYDGNYQEMQMNTLGSLQSSMMVCLVFQRNGILITIQRLKSTCTMRVSNYSYSGQYWCSACSVVSQVILFPIFIFLF